ncbi:bifunctional phosphoribosylaminoimidazolecarboxamide formyltransferase/IMP cyclohydrolase [Fulvivirga sp. 29W222]|uniref:Bifunctional purine biosynthesis protein PurH n=1 Tax=Fulvivirga marina TaxID=2494733 RepID=A0A937FWY2_9BACT|nr:bifunctional phosphoribosylaminoimidazolecarboxamide formyltransferase/IMP cyclohydrolase [Fulvivirga marina]MBL6446548.1 bifunctional phosphoribosylaminoimidazolecarboxamide formyltransferase/IMP cyclohydrolase [Fulvivirga marina]
MSLKKIKSALISVYYKDNLEPIVKLLAQNDVQIFSTGGTQKFIEDLGVEVTAVEDLTSYPSIFGGRVKTLHPKVFGGILYRRELADDQKQADEFEIPSIDLVIVDLYPFEETVASGASEQDIIEKIDIGGISLIRAAAKNFKDVLIVSSREQYADVEQMLREKGGATELADRKLFAAKAFDMSSHYDSAIFNHFNGNGDVGSFKQSHRDKKTLRYGENPHQEGAFYGDLDSMLEKLNGKEISYNNLVDIDAAVSLIEEFDDTAFAILKHTNACGVATGSTVKEAYDRAFAADTISAFGGVLITNKVVDKDAAEAMHSLFFEILIAPDFTEDALEVLKQKKNRIILKQQYKLNTKKQYKSLLNGVIEQDRDLKTDTLEDLKVVTQKAPTEDEKSALIFASKVAKHTKSNTIVLVKDGQLMASGVGQTSRVDALKQAIHKAKTFGFDLNGAVMASDAFFPFPDCVEIAHGEGIVSVIQPGGSIKDQDSIDFCDKNNMAMVFTGIRHFKH